MSEITPMQRIYHQHYSVILTLTGKLYFTRNTMHCCGNKGVIINFVQSKHFDTLPFLCHLHSFWYRNVRQYGLYAEYKPKQLIHQNSGSSDFMSSFTTAMKVICNLPPFPMFGISIFNMPPPSQPRLTNHISNLLNPSSPSDVLLLKSVFIIFTMKLIWCQRILGIQFIQEDHVVSFGLQTRDKDAAGQLHPTVFASSTRNTLYSTCHFELP